MFDPSCKALLTPSHQRIWNLLKLWNPAKPFIPKTLKLSSQVIEQSLGTLLNPSSQNFLSQSLWMLHPKVFEPFIPKSLKTSSQAFEQSFGTFPNSSSQSLKTLHAKVFEPFIPKSLKPSSQVFEQSLGAFIPKSLSPWPLLAPVLAFKPDPAVITSAFWPLAWQELFWPPATPLLK